MTFPSFVVKMKNLSEPTQSFALYLLCHSISTSSNYTIKHFFSLQCVYHFFYLKNHFPNIYLSCSGSVTSSDSGHGSCIQADTHSNCSESGIYHVASSIVHNLPSPILQQRRHSTMHGKFMRNFFFLSRFVV